MVLQDEAETTNLFARKRLSVPFSAEAVSRESEEFSVIMRLFRDEFGPIVDMLESLPDFILFQLSPSGDGNYVEGFGKASSVSI